MALLPFSYVALWLQHCPFAHDNHTLSQVEPSAKATRVHNNCGEHIVLYEPLQEEANFEK